MFDWLAQLPWWALFLIGFGSGAVLGSILLKLRLRKKLEQARRQDTAQAALRPGPSTIRTS